MTVQQSALVLENELQGCYVDNELDENMIWHEAAATVYFGSHLYEQGGSTMAAGNTALLIQRNHWERTAIYRNTNQQVQ